MCVTIGGKRPLRRSGSAIVSPSRIDPAASATTASRQALPRTLRTISIAFSSGTPLASSVESVFAKREIASIERSFPKMGRRSRRVSHFMRPSFVFTQRWKR